jgi:DNA-binding winged helix-turn-helix (wHTH) protein
MLTDPKGLPSVVRFDLYELDVENCQLRRAGLPVDLPPQALKVLASLVAKPNQLVTRNEIKENLWPGESHGDFDSRLNFTIKKLREVLDDRVEQPRYVQTVRNAGYRFVAPIRAQEILSQSEASAHQPNGGVVQDREALGHLQLPHRESRFGVKPVLIGTIVLVALMGGMGLFILREHARNSVVAVGERLRDLPTNRDGVPKISFVSPILPQARQKIVIRGDGFGLHVPFARTDSPYLAIGDETRGWAAGRLVPHNWDEVMLDVESWTDNEIVLAGFSGDYGKKGWELAEGDKVLVRVWNPQTGYGPAQVFATVSAGGSSLR